MHSRRRLALPSPFWLSRQPNFRPPIYTCRQHRHDGRSRHRSSSPREVSSIMTGITPEHPVPHHRTRCVVGTVLWGAVHCCTTSPTYSPVGRTMCRPKLRPGFLIGLPLCGANMRRYPRIICARPPLTSQSRSTTSLATRLEVASAIKHPRENRPKGRAQVHIQCDARHDLIRPIQ
jgi:hypothetical protein